MSFIDVLIACTEALTPTFPRPGLNLVYKESTTFIRYMIVLDLEARSLEHW